jgi:hypothetical protein
VYDYKKSPGNPRRQLAAFGGKGAFRTLQRMETPVIYFYSDKERSVNVTVKFPQGQITEWYPQARDIGPSTVQARPLLKTIDNTANQIGIAGLNLSAIDTKKSIAESLIRWADVKLLAARDHGDLQGQLPSDASGSHYYAARAADSDFLRVQARVNDVEKSQYEKFLFYRGVGNFKTPLQVSGDGEDYVSLRNTGNEALTDLFVLQVRNGQGKLVYVNSVGPRKENVVKLESENNALPVSDLVNRISEQMQTALLKQGLYDGEAKAMVNTWRDSWFEEQGVRVLYLLPRSWTDQVLPLTLDPQPKETVRVMVGRAEVITPAMEWELLKQIARYTQADPAAREQVVQDTRKLGLGRFAEPTMRRLTSKLSSREFNRFSSELLEASFKLQQPAKTLAQR